MEDEIGEVEEKEGEKERKVEEEQGGERQAKDEEVEEEEDDSMEWELRNTDSVFSELSELSRDYVESVDQGASVRGKIIRMTCFKTYFSNLVDVLSRHRLQNIYKTLPVYR